MAPRSRSNNHDGDWKSWKLKLYCTLPILFLETGVFATIIVLTVLSEVNHGFVHISDQPLSTIANHDIHRRLLWTTLPAVLMSLLGLVYAMIVSAVADRQPYVELVDNKPHRRSAELTILLDYLSYPPLYNWIVAFQNRHPHLGGAMLLHFLCSFSLVPLTSSLLRPAATEVHHFATLSSTLQADFDALGIHTDLQVAIDLAQAIHAYGASPPIWMTSKYSFESFVPEQESRSGDLTAATSAYSASPRCQIIETVPTGGVDHTSGLGSILLNFQDGDCPVSDVQWPVASDRSAYSLTWFQRCGSQTNPQDRIGVFSALHSASSANSLSNVTVISCFPSYQSTTVNLTMSYNGTQVQDMVSMSLGKPTTLDSSDFRTLNADLPLYRQSGFSGALNADSFGSAVHAYAHTLSFGSEFRSDVYLQATEAVYETMFAALTSTQLMAARDTARVFPGRLAITRTKLYVSLPIAVVLDALLLFMITCTIVLIVHIERSSSILTEEPRGLLGRALLLLGSDVLGLATHLRGTHRTIGTRIDQVEQNYTVADSTCWYGEDNEVGLGSIRVKDLDQVSVTYSTRSWWRRLFKKTPRQKHEAEMKHEKEGLIEAQDEAASGENAEGSEREERHAEAPQSS